MSMAVGFYKCTHWSNIFLGIRGIPFYPRHALAVASSMDAGISCKGAECILALPEECSCFSCSHTNASLHRAHTAGFLFLSLQHSGGGGML